MAFSERHTRW